MDFEIDTLDIEDTDEAKDTAASIVASLIDLIHLHYDTVQQYNAIIRMLESEDQDVELLNTCVENELTSIGVIESLLETYSPTTEKINDGKEDADLILADKEDLVLHEDYDSDEELKHEFQLYCRDKIYNLGKVEDSESGELFSVALVGDISKYKAVQFIFNWTEPDFNFIAYKDGVRVIDTPMYSLDEYAAEMTFTQIDSSYYNYLIEYWDDIGMSLLIKEGREE